MNLSMFERNVALAPFTTLRVGGPAEFLFRPRSQSDVLSALEVAKESGIRAVVLGRGSNILIRDEGISGLVILVRNGLKRLRVDKEAGVISAEAGVTLPMVASAALRAGLAGFEFMIGIPGSVGASVAINAGLGGREGCSIADRLVHAMVSPVESPCAVTMETEALRMGYRSSAILGRPVWVLEAVFMASGVATPGHIAAIQREIIAARTRKQPKPGRTCGSVFKQVKNGHPAAWYIDRAGLKGYRVGDAMITEKHANWIANVGRATSEDILELMHVVAERVRDQHGVVLEPEIRELAGDRSAGTT